MLVVGETVPHPAPEHPAPDRVQFTPRFVVFETVAANCVPMPADTVAVLGATATVMGGGTVSVMMAKADFVASATDVAVSVTVGDEGTLAGAL